MQFVGLGVQGAGCWVGPGVRALSAPLALHLFPSDIKRYEVLVDDA